MKHVIIGTAGHVDHGKTALVKALTGIDTDRLEEEKRRGVTIELGFAYIDFEDGTRAGVVDVPGHERFIRNMLAGAGGIDLAMLVIAADEGVMPQTREHLGILTQLGVADGLVVITKTDNVEHDWLELVVEEACQLVRGTFLENKPILPVSAFTGDGIDELKLALREAADAAREKDTTLPFRLPVDRVFPVDGFGIVVTGTLIEGSVSVGQTAEILPTGENAQIRSINVHSESVETACAGQRTAVCLAGIKRGMVKRGDVIASKGVINVTNDIDVRINVFPDCGRTIKNGAVLHMYHGARTLLVKAVLLNREELPGGESCYARLRLKEPLPCKRGDRFVVRFYSPLETIGGGLILNSLPKKRAARNAQALEALETRERGTTGEIAALVADEIGGVFTEADLCRRADIDARTCNEAIGALVRQGTVLCLTGETENRHKPQIFISANTLEAFGDECKSLLEGYHRDHPLRAGMNIAELRQKLLPHAEIADAAAVINALADKGIVVLSDKNAALPGFSIKLTHAQAAIRERIMEIFTKSGYETPLPDELAAMFSKADKAGYEQVLESLFANTELIMLSPQVYWRRDMYEKATGILRGHFEKADEITLAQCRDLLGTSRKYALAFLEYLDRTQVTRKVGETRRLARGLDLPQRS